jgi:hypothetical protein
MDAGNTAKQQNHLIMSNAESLPGTHFVIYCLIFWCCQTAEKMNANSVPTMPRRDASFSVSSGSLSHVFHQIYAFAWASKPTHFK